MAEAGKRFKIVYRGNLLPGFTFDSAKAKLMEMFSLSQEKADSILKSKQVILKKNVDETTAKKFSVALKQAGLDVALTIYPHDRLPRKTIREGISDQKGNAVPDKKPDDSLKDKEIFQNHDSAALPFEFYGSGSEYFRIWIVNIILSIITLGIYSAWAKVRRKQYFYANTRLQDASFEYLADPLKILKGRVVIAIVAVSYSVISTLIPIAGTILSLLFLLILPWIVIRSLSFNNRNSAYRNIRFGFKGKGMDAFKVYIFWPFLAVLTIGILFPYSYFRQKKFITENSTYGNENFTFDATAKDYYRLYFNSLLPFLLGILLLAGVGFLFAPLTPFFMIIFYFYLFAFFSVKTTNLQLSSSRLLSHRLDACLGVWSYLAIIVSNSIAIALTLGLFQPWAKIRTLRYKLLHLSFHVSGVGDLNSFIASKQGQVSAMGDEFSDFFDMDFGL